MGLFTWVYGKGLAVYNYTCNFIISCIYPNNITQTIQPIPVAEEHPEHPMLECTITDENEDEIYTSLEPNDNATNVVLKYDVRDLDPLSNVNGPLARFMLNNSRLKHLSLDGAGIDTQGLLTLANILSNENIHLESLNLANNNLYGTKWSGDTGLMQLFKSLGKNKTLKNINLSRTNITHHMGDWIAGCLKNNTTLEKIDLSHNGLDLRSINTIIQAIAENIISAVAYISLVDNSIYAYEAINTGRSFELGTQEEVYEHINKISATKNAINSSRAVIPSFLAFAAYTLVERPENKTTMLDDNCVSKIGEMLFGSTSLHRNKNPKKANLKMTDSLAIYCPAPPTWEGPKIS